MTLTSKFCFNLSSSLIILASVHSYALSTDNSQAIVMVADKVEMNYKTGLSVFTGSAKATQGTSQITGDKIITQNNNNKTITNMIAYGTEQNLATYRTTPKKNHDVFNSEAEQISYTTLTQIATLQGHAHATHGNDVFNGPNVTYDAINQIVSINQSAQGPSTIVLNPS